MKLTDDMIRHIRDTVEDMDLCMEYEHVGIRVQDSSFSLGPIDHVSHVWDDGEDTGVELGGICAININSLGHSHEYFGSHVAIICGYSAEYGEDPGEIIISDPEVVSIIC